MRYFIFSSFCFVTLVYLIFHGVERYGKYLNPVFIFLLSVAIPVLYLLARRQRTEQRSGVPHILLRLLPLLAAVAGCGLIVTGYQQGFQEYLDYGRFSDVNLQIEALYDRFAKGEQPYYPLQLITWAPFPVYMPAHWIVVGIARQFDFDFRWVGLFMLFGSFVWYLGLQIRNKSPLLQQLAAVALFLFILEAFRRWAAQDIFVTFETPVAAYYLVLAIGLVQRNLLVTTIGIILCVLSRYTIVFWFPAFALMLLHERPLKYSVFVWGSMALALFLFYILPFLMREPTILVDGVAYHNRAAIDEWIGYGSDKISWSHEAGTYFAPHFKKLFEGDMEHRVWLTRVVQACLMILLNIGAYLFYRLSRHRYHYYDISLVLLYLVLVFFYAFGPLTYKYYLLTTMVLGVALVAETYSVRARDAGGSGNQRAESPLQS